MILKYSYALKFICHDRYLLKALIYFLFFILYFSTFHLVNKIFTFALILFLFRRKIGEELYIIKTKVISQIIKNKYD
jgi:hypothetical protein